MKKTRDNVTPYYLIISDIQGKSITISAIDGSVKTVTRSRVISVKVNEINRLKLAKTILGTSVDL
jgi:penicillin V acylase-like amidase (Ntn superfamily)